MERWRLGLTLSKPNQPFRLPPSLCKNELHTFKTDDLINFCRAVVSLSAMCVADRLHLALATAAAVASPASRRRRPGLITATFSIGTAGQPWGAAEKAEWRDSRVRHRSYADEVLSQLEPLREAGWEVVQYGELSIDPARYPLFALRTREWSADRPRSVFRPPTHFSHMPHPTFPRSHMFLFLVFCSPAECMATKPRASRAPSCGCVRRRRRTRAR